MKYQGDVWIVLREEGDEDRAFITGVYSTREAANAAAEAGVRKAMSEGLTVYFNPDTEEDSVEWDVDYRVEVWEVKHEA